MKRNQSGIKTPKNKQRKLVDENRYVGRGIHQYKTGRSQYDNKRGQMLGNIHRRHS